PGGGGVRLFGLPIVVLGRRFLLGVARALTAPPSQLIAWLGAMAAVAGSWSVAVVIALIDLLRDVLDPRRPVLASCFSQLHDAAIGRYGTATQAGLLVLVGLAALAATVLSIRVGRSLARARSCTHEHARGVRIAGRHDSELDAIVIDLHTPAAYCVAGRPHAIVVTSGALESLDGRELSAVLAHERAHLDGRHHLLLALTRGVASVLPRVDLFASGAVEVARLLEMCADDAAARIHGSHTVARALFAMTEAMPNTPALGSGGADLDARLERLTASGAPEPRTTARPRVIMAATAATAVMMVIPPAVGIALCVPIPV
ncbi:M56 family metallopeptidase, partial [Nocardia abscessus]|uniref:M56 family metallopeptidase n=1 Tax=Nocardia abscessus TaxID=120957 RepID=UPI002455BCE4